MTYNLTIEEYAQRLRDTFDARLENLYLQKGSVNSPLRWSATLDDAANWLRASDKDALWFASQRAAQEGK